MKENTDEQSINSKMHAYHQQLANLNLPNISNLLNTSSQLNSIQQDSSIMSANHYHELVRNFMTQPNNCNANIASSTMTSLANRLMSLNSHELSWLNADSVLMKHITETQLLIEQKLQVMHAKTGTNDTRHNKVSQHKQQQQQQQHQATPLNHNLALQNQQHHELYSQQSQQQQQQQHQQQQQQQHHILMSPGSYLGNYAYAQQLAQLQQQQLQHHQQQQQQFFTMASRYNNIAPTNGLNARIETTATNNGGHQSINDLTLNALTTSSQLNKTANSMAQAQLAAVAAAAASAMDLRTTPRPMSATPSPVGSRAGSTGSAANSKMSMPIQHPKKMKMAEYKKMQQLAERGGTNHNNQRGNTTNSFSDRQYDETEPTSGNHHHNHNHQQHHQHNHHDENDDQNRNPTLIGGGGGGGERRAPASKRLHTDDELSAAAALAMTRTGIRHHSNGCEEEGNNSTSNTTSNGGNIIASASNTTTIATTSGKKYKGEFDEPNADEVLRRERMLIKPDHYHQEAFQVGDCACVIGSEFQDKTKMEALESLERWRMSDVEERTKWKWDINDLPKEITLPDIKKYEDLRRDFSNGRADFGGASKRRPLGIRGTRQFLLMLYCLWGHPGRDDPMQREGYCPHCFARIRTENEQSTLVRVVNHFNMKHKKGANPRLSPHSDSRQSPKAQPISPHSFQVSDTLLSMVESAAAAVDEENTDEEMQQIESNSVPHEHHNDEFEKKGQTLAAAAAADDDATEEKSADRSNAQATDKDNNSDQQQHHDDKVKSLK